mmetsp:Transcript_4076/g.8374  ORF Transcript_4076/g.8374 Transcript_4076/m.8374 type:complete len:214 (-) Transcript_4076:107-748(-)
MSSCSCSFIRSIILRFACIRLNSIISSSSSSSSSDDSAIALRSNACLCICSFSSSSFSSSSSETTSARCMSRRRSKASERSTPREAARRRSRGSSLRSTSTGGARLATSSSSSSSFLSSASSSSSSSGAQSGAFPGQYRVTRTVFFTFASLSRRSNHCGLAWVPALRVSLTRSAAWLRDIRKTYPQPYPQHSLFLYTRVETQHMRRPRASYTE